MAAKMAATQGFSDAIFLRRGILAATSYGKLLVRVKVLLMIKTKTIAKEKCFGSPARQRDFLVKFAGSILRMQAFN